jgi:hypothetical protein
MVDEIEMAEQAAQLLAGVDVPKPQRVIAAAREGVAAVGHQGEGAVVPRGGLSPYRAPTAEEIKELLNPVRDDTDRVGKGAAPTNHLLDESTCPLWWAVRDMQVGGCRYIERLAEHSS